MNATKPMPRRPKDAPPPEKTYSASVRMPASLRDRAYAVAQSEDRNLNSLVLYALRRYITERESQVQTEVGK